MTIEVQKYVRKPFYVVAVKVTEENMEAVATWCNGEIKTSNGIRYVYLKNRPSGRPSRYYNATDGDWILKSDRGFQVYNEPAFDRYFESVNGEDSPGLTPDLISVGTE